MKKCFLFLILGIFLISFISADVAVPTKVYYAYWASNGSYMTTTTPVNGAQMYGVVCSSIGCSSIAGELWGGTNFYLPGNSITLYYPTILQSPYGYGVYVFKEGYIPYEVTGNWWGTWTDSQFNTYLTKKQICNASIISVDDNYTIGNWNVNATIDSPIKDCCSPLVYIPPHLKKYYTVNVSVNTTIKQGSTIIASQEKLINMDYSAIAKNNVSLPVSLAPGTYNLTVTTTVPDSQCLSSLTKVWTKQIIIPETCTPSIINSSWSTWQNVECSGSQMNQSRFRTSYDSNFCGTTENKTYYEYRLTGPDYQNTSWSSWSNVGMCLPSDTQQQTRSLVQYDTYGCASNTTFYEYRNISCDYCQYSVANTSWSCWEDVGCAQEQMNQSRFRTEYDANYNSCYAITGLPSDLWNSGQNKTHYEFRLIPDEDCESCTPNIINSTWSAWEDVGCAQEQMNQSRFRTSYDSNYCGTVENKTYYEYRLIEDESCESCTPNIINSTWSAWEDVGCAQEQMNQSRFRTEYDANYCGTVENKTYYEYKLIEDESCEDGEIECYRNSDCGNTGCAGGPNYCCDGNVCQEFIFFTCHNPGTTDSYCSSLLAPFVLEICWFGCENGFCLSEPPQQECEIDSDCGEEELINNYCNLTEVWSNYSVPSCDSEECQFSSLLIYNSSCEFGCSAGECLPEPEECSVNEDCGVQSSVLICYEGNVNNKTINPTCNNGSCGSETNYELVEACPYGCSDAKCQPEKKKSSGGGGSHKAPNLCGDGYCDFTIGENELTCLLDCKESFLKKNVGENEFNETMTLLVLTNQNNQSDEEMNSRWFAIFLIIVLLILIFLLIYFLKKA